MKTLTSTEHQDMLALHATLRDALNIAAKQRGQRGEEVTGVYGTEFGWVQYERQILHAAVNRHQAGTGGPEITMDQVHRIEQSAEGHCDYGSKFALGLAQLAYTGDWRI